MYYKFLTADNKGEYSGFDFAPYLPKDGKPGKWLPKLNGLEMCERGYHVCRLEHISEWVSANLYEVDVKGKQIEGDTKTVVAQIRIIRRVEGWNERNLRHAAADIVEQIALPVWKKNYPENTKLKSVISVVRRYADGEATDEELTAAEAAAWAAARDAAEVAIWAAAWAAARAAAWAAAETAAWAAARDAA